MRTEALLVALLTLSLPVALLGCEPGKACNDHADCPKGASCRCDDAGRLLIEKRDINGDKIGDSMRYQRDEAGRVVVIESDWGDNGSIERWQKFGYDAEGRRVSNEGWLQQCADEKFHWTCKFDSPCEAPYKDCPKCRNTHQIEKGDGTFKPCGKPRRAATGAAKAK